MKVRMKVAVSGSRNGRDWPSIGGTIELPDVEARSYVKVGLAEPADDVETATVDTSDVETATVDTTPRRRGRPPGSKNKPKPGTGHGGFLARDVAGDVIRGA